MYLFEKHYEDLLTEYYTRVFGGKDYNYSRAGKILDDFHIAKTENGSIAFDLGSGSGFYSIPLAEKGYKVYATDLNRKLLDEIDTAKYSNIEVINDDILNLDKYTPSKIEIVTCMTDVISHLNDYTEISMLFKKISNNLCDDGIFLFSYRDQTKAKENEERIIPFFSDDSLIMTSFIDVFDDKLRVFDLLYIKMYDKWINKKSMYWRLRMYAEKINEILIQSNFRIERKITINEMTYILCRKITNNENI
jgi:SAM-dependent methyltransferase